MKNNNILKIIILIILIFLAGCSLDQLSGDAVKEVKPIPRENGEIDVYFCPKDNCSSVLVGFLNSAGKSVHCAVFDLDLEEVVGVLDDKNKKIDVRVVVDNLHYEDLRDYDFVRKDTSSQYSHNKFCVVDGKRLFMGSFNPTERGAFKNNNNMLIIESRVLSQNYEDEFMELWAGEFGDGGLVENPVMFFNDRTMKNYFCPEDRCGDRVKEEIRKAEKSIRFMTFSFTHEGIATDLVIKHRDGVDIKGLYEKRNVNGIGSKYKLMTYQGIDVRNDTNGFSMHHKVFIIDEKTVITGSFNPSSNADKNNDENILIIEDERIAGLFLDEFDLLFDGK